MQHKRFAGAEMAGFLLVALWSGSALGGYYVDDFEGYIEGTNVQSMGHGWTASDAGAVVRTLAFTNGLLPNKAVDIPEVVMVSNAVTSAPVDTQVWMDLWLNESNQVTHGLDSPDTNRIWMAGILTNGCLMYYNRSLAGGAGAWDVCTNDVRGTTIVSGQVATGTWGRVTVFQDFSTHTVALFLNGRLLRQQVPFMSEAINGMSGFLVDVGKDQTALDNVAVTNAIPAGLTGDLDSDGRPDAEEIATYGLLSTWGPSTLTASVTNGVGGAVLPVSAASILWQAMTNFTFSASPGYVVDRVWTNGALAANFSNLLLKTAGFIWSNVVASGTVAVGYWYDGARYVPGDYTTVTGALAAALAGDHVVVSNGIYAESITVSNGVSLVGTNLTGSAGDTNLTINGAMTVVTGSVSMASGVVTVTGEVAIAAGGVLTISNTAAHFGGLTIGGGGLLHMVNGTLIVGSYTNAGTFTLSLVTNMVSSAGNGTISPSGTSTMISGWSNVVYTLTATNIGYGVGSLTNNGAVTPFAETKTVIYTNPAASITNNQTITAAFVYNGIRYVPGDYETITAALAAALAGDRIMVTNGTYTESVVVANGVELTVTNSTVTFNSLTIQGLGSVVHVVNATVTVNGTTYTSTFDMDSSWGVSVAAMPLNFFDGFEAYAPGSQVSALPGFGWWASAPDVVVEIPVTKAPGSTNAVLLPAGQVVSNLVSGGGVTKVWTDLYLMETQTLSSVEPFEISVTNDGPAVMMYLGTNGWLTVFNRTAGGWDVCSNDIYGAAAPRTTGSWTRVSWLQDFSGSGTAAFLVDGHVVRQQVPFVGVVAQYHGLRLDRGRDGAAHLDSVAITTNIPSGLTYDGDGDGFADAWEVQQFGDVLLWPRGSVFKMR